MSQRDPNLPDPNLPDLLAIANEADIQLEEPDLEKAWAERRERTREFMTAIDPRVASEVLPSDTSLSDWDQAAIRIQACYRGYRGRQLYVERLYDLYRQEEDMRLEKMQQQVEEGELLVENHRLEVELDDNTTTRRNKTRHYTTNVITIQRAWRDYRRRHGYIVGGACNNNTVSTSDGESSDESHDGSCDHQPMSVSTADDSDRTVNTPEVTSDSEVPEGVSTACTAHGDLPPEGVSVAACIAGRHVIDPEPDSVASDYSEMGEHVKEHLAHVQVIRREDLAAANTMVTDAQQLLQQSLEQLPDESDLDYTKRLRKINYLSLAQEFAELKKIDADALPFDLHKDTRFFGEGSQSGDTSEADSAATTPMDAFKDFTPLPAVPSTGLVARFEMAANITPNAPRYAAPRDGEVMGPRGNHVPPEGDIEKGVADSQIPESVRKKPGSQGSHPGEDQGDFDVYNMETTLPQMDWAKLEQQLTLAAEEEKSKRKSRHNDREEIRRRLAMGTDEEYYCGERAFRKPNLQTRLQSGMNLQICFMNEASNDTENSQPAQPDGGGGGGGGGGAGTETQPKQIQPPPPDAQKQTQAPPGESTANKDGGTTEDKDFFSQQARLQAEARAALAQVRPMAHMQLEIEKQLSKKSPIAEIVGIPSLGKRRLLAPHLLQKMNLAQIQVVVNDLHSQIEALNEDLMSMLVERDDLHMEQDSMLVDIEDETRRMQECSARLNTKLRRDKERSHRGEKRK